MNLWNKKIIAGMALIAVTLASGIILIAVSQATYPLVVQDAWTSSDAGGSPQTEFPVGSLVFLNEELFYPETYYGDGAATINFLYAVTISDPNNTPVIVSVGAGFIDPGQIVVVSAGGSIPFGSMTGTYTASGMVMNGFPSQMGPDWELYAEPVDVTFTVTS